MSNVQIGDIVRMNPLDEHNRAKGKIGTVMQVMDWGAHVSWHGGSSRMRLLFQEMIPTVSTGNVCAQCGGSNLVRAGTCILCRDCGDTSGGCG